LETARKLHYRLTFAQESGHGERESSGVFLARSPRKKKWKLLKRFKAKGKTFYQSRIDRINEVEEERQHRKVSRKDHGSRIRKKYIRAIRDVAGMVQRDHRLTRRLLS
jgi:hypothetical protein